MELGGIDDRDFFSLRVDYLFYDRDLLPLPIMNRMLSFLADFMGDRGEWKKLSELNRTPITNPDYHQKAIMRDMARQGFYFGDGYRDGEPIGIFMDQPITIEYNENPGSFSKLFPFRLIQVCRENRKWMQPSSTEQRLNAFLESHLTESFNNDLSKYKSFLLSLPIASGELVKDFMDSIKLWVETRNKNQASSGYLHGFKNIVAPYTYFQVAISICFQQKAKSIEVFGNSPEGKEKRLMGLANHYKLKSWGKLQQCYNEFYNLLDNDPKLKVELTKRKRWVRDKKSIEALLDEEDKKALLIFKQLFQ